MNHSEINGKFDFEKFLTLLSVDNSQKICTRMRSSENSFERSCVSFGSAYSSCQENYYNTNIPQSEPEGIENNSTINDGIESDNLEFCDLYCQDNNWLENICPTENQSQV